MEDRDELRVDLDLLHFMKRKTGDIRVGLTYEGFSVIIQFPLTLPTPQLIYRIYVCIIVFNLYLPWSSHHGEQMEQCH